MASLPRSVLPTLLLRADRATMARLGLRTSGGLLLAIAGPAAARPSLVRHSSFMSRVSNAFSGQWSGDDMRELENTANSRPGDATSQALYTHALLRQGFTSEVVRRVESGKFSVSAVVLGVYARAAASLRGMGDPAARQLHSALTQSLSNGGGFISPDSIRQIAQSELGPAPQQQMPPSPMGQGQQYTAGGASASGARGGYWAGSPREDPYFGSSPTFSPGPYNGSYGGSAPGGGGGGGGAQQPFPPGSSSTMPLHVVFPREKVPLFTLRNALNLGLLALLGYSMYTAVGGKSGLAGPFASLTGEIAEEVTDIPTTRFSDVKGVDEAKSELEDIVSFLRDPEKYRRLGAKVPRGVLLTGPPGTGKTLLARAVAGEAGCKFYNKSASEFEEMLVGLGARRVRELFTAARKNAPAIIFLDEIDALGGKRQKSYGSNAERQTLNQLLSCMDGFTKNENVIVIAATNSPDILDAALKRPGRFDSTVDVPLPDVKGRQEIIDLYLSKVIVSPDIDAHLLARATPGFSGAQIEAMINSAALMAAQRGAARIESQDVEEARDKVIMGPAKKSRVQTRETARLTAYHEGGHTLAALRTQGATDLHKVTILPRGQSGGATYSLPKDTEMMTRENILAHIDVAMGGRAAEELIYGLDKVTTGAGSDMAQASQLARRYCLTEEHEILTEAGFLSLGELEGRAAGAGAAVGGCRIGGYDPVTRAIVYEPCLDLIINPAREQTVVEFTPRGDAGAWGHGDPGLGGTPTGVSLVVTPDHDMYAAVLGGGCEEAQPAKLKARELLPPPPVAAPTGGEEGGPADVAFRFFGSAEGGLGGEEGAAAIPAASPLGLDCPQRQGAFLELYGAWLRCGGLDFGGPEGGAPAVTFAPGPSAGAAEGLTQLLEAAGLQEGIGFLTRASPARTVVTDRAWFDVFYAEFGRALLLALAEGQAGPAPKGRISEWVLRLPKGPARGVLAGLRLPDTSATLSTTPTTESSGGGVHASSPGFRDDVVRLALHAGYSPHFTPLEAHHQQPHKGGASWLVSFSDAQHLAQPVLSARTDARSVAYSGRTWCVTVPHGFIVARRVRGNGQASRPMITGNCMSYSMSDLGLTSYADGSEPSPERKAAIDMEVEKILQDSYARVQKLLVANRRQLDALAVALMEYETLDAAEVEEVLQGRPVVPFREALAAARARSHGGPAATQQPKSSSSGSAAHTAKGKPAVSPAPPAAGGKVRGIWNAVFGDAAQEAAPAVGGAPSPTGAAPAARPQQPMATAIAATAASKAAAAAPGGSDDSEAAREPKRGGGKWV